MQESLSILLEIAQRAARAAAAVHYRALASNDLEAQTKTSPSDLVTAVDRESEQALVAAIREARPHDAILGEEGAEIPGDSGVRWILDPLDGTANLVHRYPAHSVAVGVEIQGRRKIGVVHDTSSRCVFAGIVGEGATCDSRSITVGRRVDLSQALLGTGFLPNAGVRRQQADLLGTVLPQVRDLRRSGCPSLDICGVASGVLDAYYEFGLGPWDITAAAAIAEAAGATVLLLPSTVLPDPLLVVANSQIAGALVSVLAEAGVVGPNTAAR